MRCKICGAKLKKEEGDICVNCYREYQENEDLKKDVKEQLKIKRKYSIAYEVRKYTFFIIVLILATILSFMAGGFLNGFLTIIISLALIGLLLFWDKQIAMATKITFYEKKATYTFKFLFINTQKTIKYSDIKDVSYFQTHAQKKFGYGDLCVYSNDVIPGFGYFNGIHIKNVENVAEVLTKIGKIVGLVEN